MELSSLSSSAQLVVVFKKIPSIKCKSTMIILLLNVWYNDKRMITAMQEMSGYIEQKENFMHTK